MPQRNSRRREHLAALHQDSRAVAALGARPGRAEIAGAFCFPCHHGAGERAGCQPHGKLRSAPAYPLVCRTQNHAGAAAPGDGGGGRSTGSAAAISQACKKETPGQLFSLICENSNIDRRKFSTGCQQLLQEPQEQKHTVASDVGCSADQTHKLHAGGRTTSEQRQDVVLQEDAWLSTGAGGGEGWRVEGERLKCPEELQLHLPNPAFYWERESVTSLFTFPSPLPLPQTDRCGFARN